MKRISIIVLLLVMAGTMVFASGAQEKAEPDMEPITLDIIGHRVHKLVSTSADGAGGDIVTPFIEAHPQIKEIKWNTLEIQPIHDRLFREASLPSTEVDVGFLLDNRATPGRIANLLEPLDEWQEKNPIEGFEANFGEGMLAGVSAEGKMRGIPMRAATHSLGWNKSIFDERGLGGPPKTPEEFLDYARKTTYTRSDGVKVYGYLAQSHYYTSGVNSLGRMRDGNYINNDLVITVTEEPMVKAFELMRTMYDEGVLPKNIPSLQHAEKQRMAQQGQGAMTFDVHGKIYTTFRTDDGEYTDWQVAAYPLAEDIQDEYEFGPAQTAFWALCIPHNARRKDLSWEFIKHLSSAESALAMALNGNGPTRGSVFTEPAFKESVPYAELVRLATLEARSQYPAFDKVGEIQPVINEYIERAMLGDMEPKAACEKLAQEMADMSDQLKLK